MHTGQRPKLEEVEGMLFIVVKMLSLNDRQEIIAEQLSLILSPDLVISFQERGGGCL